MERVWIIKTILKKIKINYLFLLFTLTCFITGLYKEYLIFTSILLIHELGHIISSKIFNWKMISLELNIYGCIIKYEEYINKPLAEELIVSLSGIVIQSLYFLIVFIIYKNNIIDNKLYVIIANYNYSIIFFNLVPIPPLDGYKILNIITNSVFPYKKSLNLCAFSTLFTLVLFFLWIFFNNYIGNSLIIIVLLLLKIIDEFKNKKHKFNKFLLERYLYNIKFYKIKKINKGINSMYRDYKHIFIIKDKEIDEKKMLKIHFKN